MLVYSVAVLSCYSEFSLSSPVSLFLSAVLYSLGSCWVYTLYAILSLFSLLFQCLYAILFVSSILTYYSQCLYAILSGSLFFLFLSSSILTIISVSIRYTLSFTTSGIWLSKSCIASNAFLHLLNVVSVSGGLLVSYFLRPSMITLASSNPPWESNFPSSSTVAHECMGISAFKQ